MNVLMNREEYDSLPFREDITGDYVVGQYYRVKSDPTTISKWNGHPTAIPDKQADWWNFRVDIRDKDKRNGESPD